MKSSTPAPCGRPCWVQTVLVLVCLTVMAWWALQDRIIPDADDCAARRKEANCWDLPPSRGKEVYDLEGRLSR